MSANDRNIELDFERNVIIYEIDKFDDEIQRTDEENIKIHEDNMRFLNTMVQDKIIHDYFPCPCKHGEEDDANNYNYGLIVVSEHGKYEGIAGITRECKSCNKIEYWGDLEAYTQCMAQVLTPLIGVRTQFEDIQDVDFNDTTDGLEEVFGPGCVLVDIDSDNPTTEDKDSQE